MKTFLEEFSDKLINVKSGPNPHSVFREVE